MASRKIEDMTPELQPKFHAFSILMAKAGIPFMLTCTARLVMEQVALYAQGREMLQMVNTLRRSAGMSPISFMENGHKVTWTLASKHIVNLEDDISGNDKARAFDICITRDGRPCWNLKADVNQNNQPDYEEAGRIGELVGLRWGGRFSHPDFVHFEVMS